MNLNVNAQCRRCSLGNPMTVSKQLLHQRQKMNSCVGSNNTIADMLCGVRKKNSFISLSNSRSAWAHSSLTVGQKSEICLNSLEFKALAAVHHPFFPVRDISISEMLPRTPQLIFVNVTTLEGQPYCLELTAKGWRITSLRTDCMQGDFTRMELFTTYYESIYDLMSVISPIYKQQTLSSKRAASSLEDEDFVDEKDNCSSDEALISSALKPETIQLCSICSRALAAVKSAPSDENLRKESLTYTNALTPNSSFCFPNVSTCRCGSKRRSSAVGSQMFEETESEKRMLIERLCLLNQKAKLDRRSQKLNHCELHGSSSSDDSNRLIDKNSVYNTSDREHNIKSVCSSNSSLASNFSSDLSSSR